MRDRKKSLKYYREYQETEWFATNTEAQLFLAEVLIQMGGKEKKAEAKGFVDKALQSDDPYFKSWAEDLNKKLKWDFAYTSYLARMLILAVIVEMPKVPKMPKIAVSLRSVVFNN